jgi:polysaccharide export outer membrane protein
MRPHRSAVVFAAVTLSASLGLADDAQPPSRTPPRESVQLRPRERETPRRRLRAEPSDAVDELRPPVRPARPDVPERAEGARRSTGEERTLPSPETVKPTPLTPIPDDPPPHEGAYFDLPTVIEPPDLLIVEVLEALPGRPISGERLVRPDGTVDLGFYGPVHVRGLTVPQAKEKIVLALARHLNADALGLSRYDEGANRQAVVEPKDSNRVFVDVTAYNHAKYYVIGDVASPGILACTGRDTVLSALNYAGGLLPSADRRTIRLFRPARAGKPTKEYKVALDAIEGGNAAENYQLFPGDRLIVSRDQKVGDTIARDRVSSELHTVSNTIRHVLAVQSELEKATPNMKPDQRVELLGRMIREQRRASSGEVGAQRGDDLLLELLGPLARPK